MAIESDDDAEFYNAYVLNETIRALCKLSWCLMHEMK